MDFTRAIFFWLILAVVPLWWLARRSYQARIIVLLAASLVFYAHDRPWLQALLLAYCAVDWAVALWIERTQHRGRVLAFGVAFNLLVLTYWKYLPLLLATLASLPGARDLFGDVRPPETWEIPFGISFYAFTGIAYLVDVYRRDARAERNPFVFTLFISFFPHLVAGPMLRAHQFLTHLQPATLPDWPLDVLEGAWLIARGLFKKMVLADRIAIAIDPFFLHVADPTTAGVWSLPYVWLYALQIYFDFSGYTDVARGLALWFGFRWPENFARPYLASSIQEFWRRWHITLSRFLRDYLYVPLGGSRRGPAREYGALMVTMLLGGIWHGASWSFAVWGALHGLLLSAQRLWSRSALGQRAASLTGWPARLWHACGVALTFHAVCLAWCFFRVTDFTAAVICVRKFVEFDPALMLVGDAADLSLLLLLAAYGLAALAAAIVTRDRPLPLVMAGISSPASLGAVAGGVAGVLALALLLAPGGATPPFIYFRF